MQRRAASALHLALFLLGVVLYFVFILPRWWVLTGDIPTTLATAGRIAAGVPIALAAVPVVLNLRESLKTAGSGTPELALRLRAWSGVLHVLAGVLIILTAIVEIWVGLDTAGPWLFAVYGAAAAIAVLGIVALYLSRVAEAPCADLSALVRSVGPVEAAERIRCGEVGDTLAQRTEARRDVDCAAEDLEILKRRGGRLITRDDDEWPGLAFASFNGAPVRDRQQGRAPLALWAIGLLRLDEIAERAAAIVGTRASTAYGEHVAADLSAGLAEHEVVVVSGGAYGIDGAAHRAALAADGMTVAVLAGGVDVPYLSLIHI